MTTQTVYTRPMKTVIFGFLGFTAVAAALAFAQRMGLLEPAATKRGLGLIIGVMVIVTGNFLPKVRPLNAPGVNPAKAATAAERLAGWILVLVGIVDVGLFAFAPLDLAQRISAVLGFGAIVLIALNWAWLIRGALFGGTPNADDTLAERLLALKKRKLIIPLLFAFFYALATACAVYLFRDRYSAREIGWWMSLGFWLVYAALMVALESKRSAN